MSYYQALKTEKKTNQFTQTQTSKQIKSKTKTNSFSKEFLEQIKMNGFEKKYCNV